VSLEKKKTRFDPRSDILSIRFNDIQPEDHMNSFSELLDCAIAAHRNKNIGLYHQIESLILEIKDFNVQRMEKGIAEVFSDELLDNPDAQIALLEMIHNEIIQYKELVELRLQLKISEGILLQYPIPITIQLQIILNNKEKHLIKLLKVAYDEHTAKFHDHVDFIHNRVNNLINRNRAKIKTAREEYLEKLSEKPIWAERNSR